MRRRGGSYSTALPFGRGDISKHVFDVLGRYVGICLCVQKVEMKTRMHGHMRPFCAFPIFYVSRRLQWRSWRRNSGHGWLVDGVELWTLHHTAGREANMHKHSYLSFFSVMLDSQLSPPAQRLHCLQLL